MRFNTGTWIQVANPMQMYAQQHRATRPPPYFLMHAAQSSIMESMNIGQICTVSRHNPSLDLYKKHNDHVANL